MAQVFTEPPHQEGQFRGRNCSKQQHLVSWLGETGTFPPSLLGSGLGKGKFPSWGVRTQLRLLLIPPGLTWRRACSQQGSAQQATPGEQARLQELLSLLLCPLSIQTSSCQPSTRVWLLFLPPATLVPKLCL